jgi:chemotaxis protein histidine kinase CheA
MSARGASQVRADPFNERLEEIRKRFVSRFDDRFEATDASLPLLSGEASSIEAISATYQRFHQMCGTGLTLGFAKLGHAAADVEAILLAPLRARRALTNLEVAMLKHALDALRAAARTDFQAMKIKGEHRS